MREGEGGLLLHQHVCSNVIARSGHTKKTQPALQQPNKTLGGAHGGAAGLGGTATVIMLPSDTSGNIVMKEN